MSKPSKELETRSHIHTEIRVIAENGQQTVCGLIPYNSYSEDLGGFTERIAPGAFAQALSADADILHLRDHDFGILLGRTKNNTLILSDSPEGLRFSGKLPKTSQAADLAELIQRGDIDGNSFGFVCRKDSWENTPTGVVRTLEQVDLYELSITCLPAYSASSISLRSCPPEMRSMIRPHATEKRYSKVVSAVANTPWAILPEKLEAICAILSARAEGNKASQEEVQAALMASKPAPARSAGSVAIIPVYGTISQRMSMFSEFSGGTSTQQIAASFRTALADDEIGSIIFDIDSPGGTVTGVPELVAEIMAARGKKPMVAVANGIAASAAYWIACAADRVIVTPSGAVGSVGVYSAHEDISEALAKDGVKITFISAGTYKTEGNPYEPLSQDAQASMQADVDTYYRMFVQGVAAARGVSAEEVLSGFGQGRCVLAAAAVAAGMADEVGTLDGLLATMGASDPRLSSGSVVAAAIDCTCPCDPCISGDCTQCNDADCECPGCTCDDNGGYFDMQSWRDNLALQLSVRKHRLRT